jgi:hypothetical protein
MSSASPEAPPLPGEEFVDEELVELTVGQLNDLHKSKGLETASAMGERVLAAFFDDDAQNFRERGKDHKSFRAMTQHGDLAVSYTFLYHAVGVVEQLRTLPPELGESLSFSHHKLLLPVRGRDAKLRLARRAVLKRLSVRAFDEEVRAWRERHSAKQGPRRGRPRLPGFVKALKRLPSPTELQDERMFSDQDFEYYTHAEARRLLAETEASLESLQRVTRRLRERIES